MVWGETRVFKKPVNFVAALGARSQVPRWAPRDGTEASWRAGSRSPEGCLEEAGLPQACGFVSLSLWQAGQAGSRESPGSSPGTASEGQRAPPHPALEGRLSLS